MQSVTRQLLMMASRTQVPFLHVFRRKQAHVRNQSEIVMTIHVEVTRTVEATGSCNMSKRPPLKGGH